MRLSHGSSALSATFDDPNLVAVGGLVPVVALAQSCRLGEMVGEKLTLRSKGGVNAQLKVPALVAGMVAGADSIADMDLPDRPAGRRRRIGPLSTDSSRRVRRVRRHLVTRTTDQVSGDRPGAAVVTPPNPAPGDPAGSPVPR